MVSKVASVLGAVLTAAAVTLSATQASATSSPSVTMRVTMPVTMRVTMPVPETTAAPPAVGTFAAAVPRIVEVWVDPAGRPGTVAINTGDAPAASDIFIVRRTGLATADQKAYVLAHLPAGGWTAGEARDLEP